MHMHLDKQEGLRLTEVSVVCWMCSLNKSDFLQNMQLTMNISTSMAAQTAHLAWIRSFLLDTKQAVQ